MLEDEEDNSNDSSLRASFHKDASEGGGGDHFSNKGGGENFNKVQPYSIRNLTSYPIKVVKSRRQAVFAEDPIEEALINLEGAQKSMVNSLYDSIVQNQHRLSVHIGVGLDVLPSQTVDYAVDLDKQSNILLN